MALIFIHIHVVGSSEGTQTIMILLFAEISRVLYLLTNLSQIMVRVMWSINPFVSYINSLTVLAFLDTLYSSSNGQEPPT